MKENMNQHLLELDVDKQLKMIFEAALLASDSKFVLSDNNILLDSPRHGRWKFPRAEFFVENSTVVGDSDCVPLLATVTFPVPRPDNGPVPPDLVLFLQDHLDPDPIQEMYEEVYEKYKEQIEEDEKAAQVVNQFCIQAYWELQDNPLASKKWKNIKAKG